ncbi:MAG: GNAT family N-acetyltransferase [Candidatus Hermodarchaeota archaeon]
MILNKKTWIINHKNQMFCVRDAQPEDLEQVFQLAYSEMDEILQSAFKKTGGFSWENWKSGLKQALYLPNETVKIIETFSDPKQFIGFYWASSEEIIWLTSLVITPVWQRKGIGKRIMNLIEKTLHTKNQKFIELGVQDENSAINFYKKLGFRPIERWEGRTIIMQKQLEN